MLTSERSLRTSLRNRCSTATSIIGVISEDGRTNGRTKLVVDRAVSTLPGLVDMSDLQQLPDARGNSSRSDHPPASTQFATWRSGSRIKWLRLELESWLAFLRQVERGRKKVSEKIDKSKHDDSFISADRVHRCQQQG